VRWPEALKWRRAKKSPENADDRREDLDEAAQGIVPGTSPGFTTIKLEPVDEAAQGIAPDQGPTFNSYPKEERQRHADNTRRWLAYLIIGVVLTLDAALVATFIISTSLGGSFSKEDFSQAVTNLAGPNALAAAVIGFYYGKTSDAE
jgi:hypothetical protein